MADIKLLSPKLQANVRLAAEDTDVQRLIVQAIWGCMERADTGVSDIIEDIEAENITNSATRLALWGEGKEVEAEEGEEEGEWVPDEEEQVVFNNVDAIAVLIDLVKEKVLQLIQNQGPLRHCWVLG